MYWETIYSCYINNHIDGQPYKEQWLLWYDLSPWKSGRGTQDSSEGREFIFLHPRYFFQNLIIKPDSLRTRKGFRQGQQSPKSHIIILIKRTESVYLGWARRRFRIKQQQQLYLFILYLLVQVNAVFVHELTQGLWVSKAFRNLSQRQEGVVLWLLNTYPVLFVMKRQRCMLSGYSQPHWTHSIFCTQTTCIYVPLCVPQYIYTYTYVYIEREIGQVKQQCMKA